MPLNNNDITEGSISRGIMKLAVPTMAGFILQNVFNIVDMYFVGKLGAAQLAAVSVSGIFIGLIYTFALGISTGTVAIVARLQGEGDMESAAKSGKQSVFLGFFIYVFLLIFGNIIIGPILHLLGVESDIFPMAVQYARIILSGSFVVFIPMALNAYLRGSGDTVTPMRVMIIAAVLNVIFDPILIFGLLGFPKLGVAGSAIATVLARFCGMLYIIYHVSFKAKDLRLKLLPIKIDFREMWRILKIGIFGSAQSALRNMSEIVMMKLVVNFGTAAIASYGIGLRLRMAILLPILGMGVAASTMVGQNLGAKKPGRAEKAGWVTAGFSLVVMTVSAVLFFIFAENIVSMFNKDPAVIRDGVLFIRYFSPTFLFIGLSISMEKALNGAGDTISPMIITLIGLYVVRIPIVIYLMNHFGMEGIWMGIAISSIIGGLIFCGWFRVGRWKLKKI
ncbi:MAG: MATE family efflux transporter [Candidatus Eremiobacteraeota bacterium]|nr:MATE family efflux transporter [Candidatus Eremiobacteraeota bacterium]